jgi:uncharacterized membrane protein YidH (DUF202 family)
MNGIQDDLKAQRDLSPPSFARAATRFSVGMALMLLGVAAIVGGFILHFAEKAKVLELLPFPYAGQLIILIGVSVIVVAITVAGG